MSAKQRLAVFNLSVAAAALAAFAGLIPVLGVWRAQGALGLLGLTGVGVIAYRLWVGRTICDERDQLIHLRSLQVGFGLVWLIVVAGIMSACSAYGFDGSVPSRLLTLGLFLTAAAFVLGQSAALLVLYRVG